MPDEKKDKRSLAQKLRDRGRDIDAAVDAAVNPPPPPPDSNKRLKDNQSTDRSNY